MPETEAHYWRKCTTCKKPIGFVQKYWICSVSTCNRVRTDLVFCDLRCFDAHVPVMNHRDAGAFEKISPSQKSFMQLQSQVQAKNPIQAPAQTKAARPATTQSQGEESLEEILVVVSKVKAYIRAKSGMNTSEAVMGMLSQYVRKCSDQAILQAKQSGRSTVMDRDFIN